VRGNNAQGNEQAAGPGEQQPAFEMSLKMMFLYSIANVGALALDSTFDQFSAMLYINRGVLANPMLLGIAIFIGRSVDALANPAVGYWSDTSYGKRGRRVPFILKGTIPMTLLFILFFFPVTNMPAVYSWMTSNIGGLLEFLSLATNSIFRPFGISLTRNESVDFLYATLTCSGMLFFYTYVVAPYLALLPDLARTNDDRVKLSTYQSLTGIIGILIGFVIAGLLVDYFLYKQGSGDYSYGYMGFIIAILSALTFYIMAFTIREKPIAEEDRARIDFWKSILPSLRNRPFLIYIFSISSFWVGFKVLQTSINFVCHKMFGKSEAFGSYFGMGGIILVWLLSLPLVFTVQKKFGKRAVFAGALLAIAVISGLQGFIGLLPGELGLYYYLFLIFCFGVPFAALLVLYNAVLGDIIDLDEKQMGFRREAMYYGMEGFFTKTARGLGAVMIMMLFQIFGRPTETNHTAMVLAGPMCAVFAFIGFLLFSRYPIKD